MSYRRSRKYSAERLKRMQVVRDRTRMAEPAPDYPQPLPDLRMRITVERFDFGTEAHTFELRRTRRCDQYAVVVDGKPWKVVGLSGVLEGLRKAMPRALSERATA